MTPPLGPLEFRAEDFRTESLQLPPSYLPAVAEQANRLLAERLGKAKVVYQLHPTGAVEVWVPAGQALPDHYDTARLVCIEKLEGK